MTAGEGRPLAAFPTVAQVLEMVSAGNQLQMIVPGEPQLLLYVSEGGTEVGLVLPDNEPDAALPTHPALITAALPDGKQLRVACRRPDLLADFVRLGASVVERMQTDKMGARRALLRAIRSWRELTRTESSPRDLEIGLMGELWTLRRLALKLGPQRAISAWVGPLAEEHDFVLDEGDLEVKTTSSESRVHTISGIDQLSPTGHRRLCVLSLQLTSAGDGGVSVSDYLATLAEEFETRGSGAAFEDALELIPWLEEVKSSPHQWRLRTEPRLVAVTSAFPRLRREMLESLEEPIQQRISDVSYRVWLDGLGVSDGNDEFTMWLGRPAEDRLWS